MWTTFFLFAADASVPEGYVPRDLPYSDVSSNGQSCHDTSCIEYDIDKKTDEQVVSPNIAIGKIIAAAVKKVKEKVAAAKKVEEEVSAAEKEEDAAAEKVKEEAALAKQRAIAFIKALEVSALKKSEEEISAAKKAEQETIDWEAEEIAAAAKKAKQGTIAIIKAEEVAATKKSDDEASVAKTSEEDAAFNKRQKMVENDALGATKEMGHYKSAKS